MVPTHERPIGLRALVDGLRAQTLDPRRFEVVVVDDGSQPPQAVDARELDVRLVRHERSRGPAAARNAGWRAAHAPLVAFIDDDCVPTPGWLAAIVAAAGGEGRLLVQGPVEPVPEQRHRLGPLSHSIEVPEPSPLYVSCNIAYSRDVLEATGGFDERFPRAVGEDVDLGVRAVRAGARTRWAAGALVHHEVRVVGLAGMLRHTLKWTDAVEVVKLHPELRELLVARVFWKPTHPLLLLALAGGIVRRPPLGPALALPYLAHYGRLHRRPGRLLRWLPAHLAIDACEVATALVGSVRFRTLML